MAAVSRQAPPLCGGIGLLCGRANDLSSSTRRRWNLPPPGGFFLSTKVPAALTGRRAMKTVSGLFETDAQARDAVAALEDAGIASDEISLVSRDGKAGSDAAEGVGIGS